MGRGGGDGWGGVLDRVGHVPWSHGHVSINPSLFAIAYQVFTMNNHVQGCILVLKHMYKHSTFFPIAMKSGEIANV